MSVVVFYSWQSDSDRKTNRNFIEDALERAIRELRQDIELTEALRDGDWVLDKDTKGVPGTPPIVDTILQKISACSVFVADLTFVAHTPQKRAVPNPNVLVEYGWALRVHGHGRMLPVMNTAYGDPAVEALPFDMRHLRHPITYHLPEGADAVTQKSVRDSLVRDFADALRLISKASLPDQETPPAYTPIASTTDPSTFLQTDEQFPVTGRFGVGNERLVLPDCQRLFLRLIPTAPSQLLTNSKIALDLARSGNLKPMSDRPPGYFHERNKHGAFACSHSEGKIDVLTQLFKSGELWGIDCWTVAKEHCTKYGKVDFGYFASVSVEDVFAETLENYLSFAQHALGLRLPLAFMAGATGVEGYQMTAPAGMRIGMGQYGGRVVEQNLVFSGKITQYGVPTRTILRPFFEYIWEECGLQRPDKERLG